MTPRPGDIVFVHSKGWIGSAIRFGERLPGRRLHLRGKFRSTYWNHVAIVVDPVNNEPSVVQATGRGIVRSPLSVLGKDYEIVPLSAFPTLRTFYLPDPRCIVEQAYRLLGARYGWLTIFSIIINLWTPKWFRFPDFRRGATFICSAAAAFCLHAGGADIDTPDIYSIMPSELRALAR